MRGGRIASKIYTGTSGNQYSKCTNSDCRITNGHSLSSGVNSMTIVRPQGLNASLLRNEFILGISKMLFRKQEHLNFRLECLFSEGYGCHIGVKSCLSKMFRTIIYYCGHLYQAVRFGSPTAG